MVKLGKYLMSVLALAAMSCSSEGDVPQPVAPSGSTFEAGLYVTFYGGEDAASSRAPQDEGYEIGSQPENFIDVFDNDYRIFFFDKNDTYTGQLKDMTLTPITVSGVWKRYRLDGEITDSKFSAMVADKEFSLKVVMLANWRKSYPEPVPGVTRLSDLATATGSLATFDPVADQTLDKNRPMPLFGVTNAITGVTFTPGQVTDLGNLHLLRAYAKVRVREGAGSLPLKSVRMLRANTAYYRVPRGVKEQDDYVNNSWAEDYYQTPSIPDPAGLVTDAGKLEFSQDATGDWVFYMPEFRNIDNCNPKAPLTNRTQIVAVFDDGKGKEETHYVDFKFYNDPPSYATGAVAGDYFDVLRNTIYDYTLTKSGVQEPAEVTIEVDVQPYAELWLTPDFGLMRDEDGDLMVELEYDNDGNVIRDKDGSIKLPEYMKQYLAAYGKKLPDLTPIKGDYFAIHLVGDGQLMNAEIWLKDSDGDQVLSDFSASDATDRNCSTRKVIYASGNIKTSGYKDRDGDIRLKHFTNHSSIILDREGYILFKTKDDDGVIRRYQIESWVPGSDTFWVIGETVYIEYKDGVATGTKKPR